MIDFGALQTPPAHGDVLVAPDANRLPDAARSNDRALRAADGLILSRPICEWRRETRSAIVGSDDRPVIVTGHQPAFIHPGVWAKHIVASRLAGALEGVALNLVVDTDAPASRRLAVPVVRDGAVALDHLPVTNAPAGMAFEQWPRRSPDQLAALERQTHDALGDRYDESQMPGFFHAARNAVDAADWVEQSVAGRRAIERSFGVEVVDRRVSALCGGVLVFDMLRNAPRFAARYNRALAEYRKENRIRGLQRPIPDLAADADGCEVPVWAIRASQPRRRVRVRRDGDSVRLFAEAEEIGRFDASAAQHEDTRAPEMRNGWRLRPRALTLTIWARLLLADLFIHGIGGAKYDRISDAIMRDYYGVTPPLMACVSATLLLDLPRSGDSAVSVREAMRAARDLTYNPQRHLSPSAELHALLTQRDRAVQRSRELRERDPRNHAARRSAFFEVRAANERLLRTSPSTVTTARARIAQAIAQDERDRIATNREYFIGLYDRPRLRRLLDALPPVEAFRV